MNTFRYLLAEAGKELQVLAKDRASLGVLFLLPLLLASLLGSVYSSAGAGEDSEESSISLDVFLVEEDSGRYAAQIVGILDEIDQLNIEKVETSAEADALVADGQALAAIIIPAGFSDQIDAHQPTMLQVVVDPVQEQAASIITGMMNRVVAEVVLWGEITYGIRSVFDESGILDGAPPEMRQAAEAQSLGVIMTQLQAMRQDPVINVKSESISGLEESASPNVFGFVVPNFTVMFSFFLIGTIATAILKEKETGTFRRLMASPMPRSAIIGGKMAAYMLVIVLQVVVLFGVANVIFNMPLGDSLLGLFLLTVTLAMASSALGMLLAAVATTSSMADSGGMILGFILAGLGGCIVTFSPGTFMGNLALLTPHGHAVQGFYKLINDGLGAVEILPQAGFLAAFAVVFFAGAIWRFRFE